MRYAIVKIVWQKEQRPRTESSNQGWAKGSHIHSWFFEQKKRSLHFKQTALFPNSTQYPIKPLNPAAQHSQITMQETDGNYTETKGSRPWHWRRSGRPWPEAGPSTRWSGRFGAADGGRFRGPSGAQLNWSLDTGKNGRRLDREVSVVTLQESRGGGGGVAGSYRSRWAGQGGGGGAGGGGRRGFGASRSPWKRWRGGAAFSTAAAVGCWDYFAVRRRFFCEKGSRPSPTQRKGKAGFLCHVTYA